MRAARRTALVMVGSALVLTGSVLAQAAQVVWVDHAPKLTPLPVAVGGRALMRAGSGGEGFGAKTYVYQWPGTHFEAAFQGPEVYFRLGPQNKQLLHVTVDHQPAVVLTIPKAGTYRVGGLGAGPHRVRVEVVTENQAATSVFGGFAIPAGERSLPVAMPKRQMEMIGDSHTLGYGNASAKRECSRDEVLYATDVERTAGVMAADHYGAEYQVVAISGRGVVRNYGGGPGDPMPVAYPYVLEDKAAVYRNAAWQPQVVVISLGTNDLTGPALHAGERWKTRDDLHRDFEATYARFIGTLRARYPGAFFILWATDAGNGEIQAEVQKVVAMLKTGGETRVQFIPVSLGLTACDWHPSLGDNKLIYGKLIAFIDAHPKLWRDK